MTMPSFVNSSHQYQPRDDSIEEMASMLLDDTTMDQLNTNTEPGRRLSQAAAAEIFNNSGHMGSGNDKSLPQLPKLLFNGDDAWAMKTAPVVTAAGNLNQMSFNGDLDPLSMHPVNHARKGSVPAVPRKSSKRRSGRPKSQFHISDRKGGVEASRLAPICTNMMPVPKYLKLTLSREALKTRISPPKPIDLPLQKPFDGTTEINDKVQAMLAATKALKGDDRKPNALPRPQVPPKKRRIGESKVLTKMKSVLNDRLQGRSSRKREGRLLDESVNEGQDFHDEISASAAALTTLEIRMNEGTYSKPHPMFSYLTSLVGDNFKKPKIHNLTGHGNVPRKPLADDGKSLRSRKSVDDPFSEQAHLKSASPVPASFEARLKDDMSIDESRENTPDLPNQAGTPERPAMNFRRSSGLTDFDTILSSSPVAQSTPRIRLEPSFGDSGKKILKNVPADSRSVFDFDTENISDMELDSDPPSHKVSIRSPTGTPIKKSSQAKRHTLGAGVRGFGSRRMKKHPSPSKAELEKLEHAMRDFPHINFSEDSPAASSALAPKDINKKLQDSRRRNQVYKGGLKVPSLELTRTTESMPSISGYTSLPRNVVSFQATTDDEKLSDPSTAHSSGRNNLAETGSMMDVDELQWDDVAYTIGMRAAV